MQISKDNIAGSLYQSVMVEVKGNKWEIMKVTGASNYVSVRKATNNPFATLGKSFADEDEALAHYKSPAMQTAIIQVLSEME